MVGINLHGEVMDIIPEEEAAASIKKQKEEEFHNLIKKLFSVKDQCIFNPHQTGHFCRQKLPNCLCVRKENKQSFSGVKQMKAKNQITLMVCIAADGSKVSMTTTEHTDSKVHFFNQCQMSTSCFV